MFFRMCSELTIKTPGRLHSISLPPRKRQKTCSKLTIKTPERHIIPVLYPQKTSGNLFIVNNKNTRMTSFHFYTPRKRQETCSNLIIKASERRHSISIHPENVRKAVVF